MDSIFVYILMCVIHHPAGSRLQLHPWSLADLQQDMWRRDPATNRQVPGAAVLLPDCCWPARWRVRGGQTCSKSALLPHSLLWCFRQRERKWKGGGGGGGDAWERRAARLGVWGLHRVFRELWWRYGSLFNSLILKLSLCKSPQLNANVNSENTIMLMFSRYFNILFLHVSMLTYANCTKRKVRLRLMETFWPHDGR